MSCLLSNLKKIEELYHTANDSEKEMLLLKLAFLEFAGWIENSFDDICCKISKNDSKLEKEIQNYIKSCYSYTYEKLRRCLCFCIGIKHIILLENCFNEKDLKTFSTTLDTIKKKRDELAHNQINGVMQNFMIFSEIKKNLKIVRFGFSKIQAYLRHNKLI